MQFWLSEIDLFEISHIFERSITLSLILVTRREHAGLHNVMFVSILADLLLVFNAISMLVYL